MIDQEWPNNFVGVPYKVNGRDRSGWDCWGLIMAVYSEMRGISLPDWQVASPVDGCSDILDTSETITKAVAAEMSRSTLLPGPEPWAIAVVRRQKLAYHVGVAVTGYRIIHCSEYTRGTVCVPIDRFLNEYSNTTFWRWNG